MKVRQDLVICENLDRCSVRLPIAKATCLKRRSVSFSLRFSRLQLPHLCQPLGRPQTQASPSRFRRGRARRSPDSVGACIAPAWARPPCPTLRTVPGQCVPYDRTATGRGRPTSGSSRKCSRGLPWREGSAGGTTLSKQRRRFLYGIQAGAAPATGYRLAAQHG